MPTFDHWVLLAIAVVNAITAAVSLATLHFARRTELNTNSMKDELVAATRKSALGEGRDAMRVEAEGRAADLAKGRLETKPSLEKG